jgi:pilus assembly protein CpaB
VSSRRTVILLAAIVIGAIAAFALYTYIGGIEDEANDNARRVEVFKVAETVPKGTFGDQAFADELIVRSEIPAEFRPDTAITDPEQIRGLVSINSLPANQVITEELFVSPELSLDTFASLLDEGQVAITVSVDQVRGVAGLLVPGDVVNVLVATENVNAEAEAQGETGDAQPGDVVYTRSARYLYQKVKILAIGQSKELQPGQTASTNPDGTAVAPSSGLITFSVPPEAAQRIASAGGDGLYLTLVPEDYQPRPLPPLDTSEILPGEDPARLTPYGPAGPEED